MELGHGIPSAPSAEEPSVGPAASRSFTQRLSLVSSTQSPPEPPQSLVELLHEAPDETGLRRGRQKEA